MEGFDEKQSCGFAKSPTAKSPIPSGARVRASVVGTFVFGLLIAAGAAVAQTAVAVSAANDPGPRGGTPGAGGQIVGLTTVERNFFSAAAGVFAEVDSVSGTVAGETGVGLGPRFNGNSCAQCHAFPAAGGSSPPTNPQVALANLDGATNTVPSFITSNGPVREARFINNPD